jgi:flagellar assembly factor FliW
MIDVGVDAGRARRAAGFAAGGGSWLTDDKVVAMQIVTTRFGVLEIEASDLITFPLGLMGLEDSRHWVLLADAHNDALGWLQSASRPDTALAVVSPRRFVPAYQLRVAKSDLAPLALDRVNDAQVLVTLGKNDSGITLNLKAPLVINVEQRLGRQVVSTGDHPVQYELPTQSMPLRKSA